MKEQSRLVAVEFPISRSRAVFVKGSLSRPDSEAVSDSDSEGHLAVVPVQLPSPVFPSKGVLPLLSAQGLFP